MKKIIQLEISISKVNGNEFTETEADDFMDDFADFIESKSLLYGGGHKLI